MSTVILGAGIIGSSIAFYISEQASISEIGAQDIHIVELSTQLFSAASGYAAGFLAENWFAPSVSSLGALSFKLHHELATEHNGSKVWGYMKGTAFSLNVSPKKKPGGPRGDDWLRDGKSRAETAAAATHDVPVAIDKYPAWLTRQEGADVEKISDGDSVAQVDPLRLSQFLLDSCLKRGVKLHQSAKAISVTTDDSSGAITSVRILNTETQEKYTVACTNLIISGGPWTPQIFSELFPTSKVSIPISPLAGYSLVLRSPRHTLEHERISYDGCSHAVFTTHPASSGFNPEIFSREGGEIYIAGLNSAQIPLPRQAEEAKAIMNRTQLDRLKQVAVRLMGRLSEGEQASSDNVPNIDDLEVLREGLCFRPVVDRGTPIVARVAGELLGNDVKASQEKDKGGVYIASGHGPWGISLSLGTGKVVAEMVLGTTLSADVSGLGLQ